LLPGSVIGILGGGQLGRMLALAAARLGYRCHVFCPDKDAPAGQVSEHTVVAAYDDTAALDRFAQEIDLATYEFENIPVEPCERLIRTKPLYPSPAVLACCQDRIREKTFLQAIGIPTAPFDAVDGADRTSQAVQEIGVPAVLKSARLGYDGKAQVRVSRPEDAPGAWATLASTVAGIEGIVEQWVDFALEISVIVARAVTGQVWAYVPVENVHENHVLRRTIAPAPISEDLADAAIALATRIAEALDVVGLLAVEMFVTRDGRLLVNELAPRPHNSGHWTIDACTVSQFEQCIRAISGLPLGNPERHANAVMENLLGNEIDRWREVLADPTACLHLYGKREARPGRKMGHVTWLFPRTAAAPAR
jgi:5-(carboxyamino)imidazole ribonucleotide synthase